MSGWRRPRKEPSRWLASASRRARPGRPRLGLTNPAVPTLHPVMRILLQPHLSLFKPIQGIFKTQEPLRMGTPARGVRNSKLRDFGLTHHPPHVGLRHSPGPSVFFQPRDLTRRNRPLSGGRSGPRATDGPEFSGARSFPHGSVGPCSRSCNSAFGGSGKSGVCRRFPLRGPLVRGSNPLSAIFAMINKITRFPGCCTRKCGVLN